ncbi:MAG: dTDP-4-dehydrorhamnose 3,5-epimerase [Candidatus Dadabacteria bacterium]|nr:MAG: dTDP-4-dehydrorhamnose 3,5-epimerase [Candidatus Dadabacteria bacterium]
MVCIPTELDGVVIIEPRVFRDARGFFIEDFHVERYTALTGGRRFPVQVNHSRSRRGTLRGLHFQYPRPQAKLVWVGRGRIYDVAVDVRRGSPTFGRWVSAELSDENHRQVWIPAGFAHGFCVLSEVADCYYACGEVYAADCERVVRWNDPGIAIEWPIEDPLLSDKDRNAPLLAELEMLPEWNG